MIAAKIIKDLHYTILDPLQDLQHINRPKVLWKQLDFD